MANRKAESWYSVTLNLGRITGIVPAEPTVAVAAPSASDASLGYTAGPVAKYGWER